MLRWLIDRADDLFGAARSGSWPRVRREHLAREPACAACGRAKDVEVHHIQPFHERPELELDPTNLVTLCADPCHLVFGHLLDYRRRHNPHVRDDAARYRKRLTDFR